MKKFNITNVWICRILDDRISPVFGDIEIEDGRIIKIKVRKHEFNGSHSPDDIDAAGRVVTVPNINFHEHFYSRLAKGLPLNAPMTNFQEILINLWWKLDKLIDKDILKASVNLGALESIRHGVTYVFDHHSSPLSLRESLSGISCVLSENSIRGVLCFETSERNGKQIVTASLEEHLSFLSEKISTENGLLFGLHASFTISQSTIEKISDIIAKHGLGIHIHLCEDKIDDELTRHRENITPVERLSKYGLLNSKSILAHAIHLQESDYKIIKESGAAISYNLHSNMNNAVGLPDFKMTKNIPVLIGTDGMHANIPSSLKQYFLLMRNSGMPFEEVFLIISANYFKQLNFVKQFFPDFSQLSESERADCILWDYVPPTPLNESNFWGHYIYGIIESPVRDVIQNGNFLMRDFIIQNDSDSLRAAITEQGNRLYRKFSELK